MILTIYEANPLADSCMVNFVRDQHGIFDPAGFSQEMNLSVALELEREMDADRQRKQRNMDAYGRRK